MPHRIQLPTQGRTHEIWVHVTNPATSERGQVIVALPYGVASMDYVNAQFRKLGLGLKAITFMGHAPAIVAPF